MAVWAGLAAFFPPGASPVSAADAVVGPPLPYLRMGPGGQRHETHSLCA